MHPPTNAARISLPLQVLVGEPSVPDTVQILRGLKERYASHHGVNIADRALVMAAELADRWVAELAGHGGYVQPALLLLGLLPLRVCLFRVSSSSSSVHVPWIPLFNVSLF